MSACWPCWCAATRRPSAVSSTGQLAGAEVVLQPASCSHAPGRAVELPCPVTCSPPALLFHPVTRQPTKPPTRPPTRPPSNHLTDHMSDMKLSLEHLAFLPPNAALALLLAVWPMCRSGMEREHSGVGLGPRGVQQTGLAAARAASQRADGPLLRPPARLPPPTQHRPASPSFPLRARRDAQDYVVMLLRKAMFRYGWVHWVAALSAPAPSTPAPLPAD